MGEFIVYEQQETIRQKADVEGVIVSYSKFGFNEGFKFGLGLCAAVTVWGLFAILIAGAFSVMTINSLFNLLR